MPDSRGAVACAVLSASDHGLAHTAAYPLRTADTTLLY
jgi:hypothetical protein